jgi:hypothetical protein
MDLKQLKVAFVHDSALKGRKKVNVFLSIDQTILTFNVKYVYLKSVQ